jgi:hypothetical protein
LKDSIEGYMHKKKKKKKKAGLPHSAPTSQPSNCTRPLPLPTATSALSGPP